MSSGFERAGARGAKLTKPYRILTLGREPLRIDVLTSIAGISFAKVWKGRVVIATTAGDIPVIGLAELRVNKAAAGRPQDLLDLALLDELALAKRRKRRRR